MKLEEAVKIKQKTRQGEVLLQGQRKDVQSSQISTASSINSSKPHLPPKPSVGHKPVLPPKPVVSPLSKGDAAGSKEKPLTSALGVEDILNYIKDNAVGEDVEPDLFWQNVLLSSFELYSLIIHAWISTRIFSFSVMECFCVM